MFSARFRLFRLLGIPIYADISWFLILALVTWSIGLQFKEILGVSGVLPWLLGFAAALTFFACLVLHELGHAVAARYFKMPVRGITLFLFGGVAELGDEPPSALSEFVVAIGGPIVSVILAGLFIAGWVLTGAAGGPPALQHFLFYLGLINAIVLVFNMIPAFPLDGGRVLRSILWATTGSLRRATYYASLAGQGFAWLLIGIGLLNLFGGFWVQGLWLGLIGLFLNNAARGSYQQVLIRQALEGEPVRRFMNPQPIVVPPDISLREWVEDYVYRYHRKTFPVSSDGRTEGCISTSDLAKFPRESWAAHTVAEAMRTDVETVTVSPDDDALLALKKMQSTGSSRLLVAEGGRLVGIVSLKDLLRFLDLKLELGDEAPGALREERREQDEEMLTGARG